MIYNGAGYPHIKVAAIEPGSYCDFGTDDDIRVLIVANVESTSRNGYGEYPTRKLIMLCCDPEYKFGALIVQELSLDNTLALVTDSRGNTMRK